MTAVLKIEKWQYLQNRFADFDKILHGDAIWHPDLNSCLKNLGQGCTWRLLPVKSNMVDNQYLELKKN